MLQIICEICPISVFCHSGKIEKNLNENWKIAKTPF